MAWIEGHDDELRVIAARLATDPHNLADKWASSALRAGEFQWAIESMLSEADSKNVALPRDLIEAVRMVSPDLLPARYRSHDLITA